jgi:hypothetical protein
MHIIHLWMHNIHLWMHICTALLSNLTRVDAESPVVGYSSRGSEPRNLELLESGRDLV